MGNKQTKEDASSLQTNLVFRDKAKLEDNYEIAKDEQPLGTGRKQNGTKIVRAESKRYDHYFSKTESRAGVGGFAIKFYQQDNNNNNAPPKTVAPSVDLREEARILKLCDHPYIVKLYQVSKSKNGTTTTTTTSRGSIGSPRRQKQRHVSLIMELCSGGTLAKSFPFRMGDGNDNKNEDSNSDPSSEAAKKNRAMVEKEAKRVISQVLRALAHLHSKHIVHRDIEPTNIMYRTENNWEDSSNNPSDVVLVDFGSAKQMPVSPKTGKRMLLQKKAGTVQYMAPEVVKGEPYGPPCDIWSVGVLTYNLLRRGEQIYMGTTTAEIEDKIKNGLYGINYASWGPSKDIKDFLQQCLTRKASARPSAVDLLGHRWLKDVVSNSTSRVLYTSPSKNNKSGGGLFAADEKAPQEQAPSSMASAGTKPIMPTELLVSMELYLKANPLKRIALNALANNSRTLPSKHKDFFLLLDTSFRGSLTFEEFASGLYESGFSDEEIQQLFSNMDVNQNNDVQYTEWMAATFETSGCELEEDQIKEAFDLLDRDQSGVISKKNLFDLLGGATTPGAKERASEVWNSVVGGGATSRSWKKTSKFGDGVTYEQFAQMFEHGFADRGIDPIAEASLNEEQIEHLRESAVVRALSTVQER